MKGSAELEQSSELVDALIQDVKCSPDSLSFNCHPIHWLQSQARSKMVTVVPDITVKHSKVQREILSLCGSLFEVRIISSNVCSGFFFNFAVQNFAPF